MLIVPPGPEKFRSQWFVRLYKIVLYVYMYVSVRGDPPLGYWVWTYFFWKFLEFPSWLMSINCSVLFTCLCILFTLACTCLLFDRIHQPVRYNKHLNWDFNVQWMQCSVRQNWAAIVCVNINVVMTTTWLNILSVIVVFLGEQFINELH